LNRFRRLKSNHP